MYSWLSGDNFRRRSSTRMLLRPVQHGAFGGVVLKRFLARIPGVATDADALSYFLAGRQDSSLG